MNVRLIIGILGAIIAVEFFAIIYQVNVYKHEVEKSIEYEKFRKQVLEKAERERAEIREMMKTKKELKEKLEELNSKREKIR